MKSFRTVLFWMHLTCGVAAGIVVLIMSVTGVALTYEKQMVEWSDRSAWTAPLSSDASALPPETLLAQVIAAQPGAAPTGLTLRADRSAPATLQRRARGNISVGSWWPRVFIRACARFGRTVVVPCRPASSGGAIDRPARRPPRPSCRPAWVFDRTIVFAGPSELERRGQLSRRRFIF